MELSNKDRILELLKTESLTSNEIADKLSLSKQDTRTYLLRLKKQKQIKTLGKRGRQFIYTYKSPGESEKSRIDTSLLVELLKDYLESEPKFKHEVKNKIAELESKLNTIASKTKESYTDLEEELEMLQYIESPEIKRTRSPEFLYSSTFESPVLEKIDTLLDQLIVTIPEVKAATLVSIEGELIASALPRDVDEMSMGVMVAALLSLAESAISLIKSGEFEQLFIRGRDGYLLVIPAGNNAVLSVSTSRDVRLGVIYLDCKRVSETIAKLI
ncbi:MAG: roadblock/LC7 domain-containing protein [Candidatus Heimdallarchaeota archaeon]